MPSLFQELCKQFEGDENKIRLWMPAIFPEYFLIVIYQGIIWVFLKLGYEKDYGEVLEINK